MCSQISLTAWRQFWCAFAFMSVVAAGALQAGTPKPSAAAGAPRISYVKFEWLGDIKSAHAKSLTVLKEAGYRVVAGQEDHTYSSYATFPNNSVLATMFAHILCSPISHGEVTHTNVIIITAGDNVQQVSDECDHLYQAMRYVGSNDREAPKTLARGTLESTQTSQMPTKTEQPPPAGHAFIYAVDLRTTYTGAHASAAEAVYRIMDEMEFNPASYSLAHPPEVQLGGKAMDNVAAVLVSTPDESKPIQMHTYVALRYYVPDGANQKLQVAKKNEAKELALQYAADLCHVLMTDPNNKAPVQLPK